MLHTFACEKRIIEHCKQVAQVADLLAAAVNGAGGNLHRKRLQAAALLHDCRRSQPNHAAAGAAALCRLDFPQIAELVAQHMDLVPLPSSTPSEAEILYLADKLTAGNRCVTLEERFAPKLNRFANQAVPLAAVRRRLDAAQQIQHKLEQMTGNRLEQLLNRRTLDAVKG